MGFFDSALHAFGGVVSSISQNGLKMPSSASAQSSSPAPPAPPKQSPSLPSVAAPDSTSSSSSTALSTLQSLILKSTQPLIDQINADVSNEVSSVEHAIIFAAVGGAAGALLYESNRIAAALAGVAAGLYLGSQTNM